MNIFPHFGSYWNDFSDFRWLVALLLFSHPLNDLWRTVQLKLIQEAKQTCGQAVVSRLRRDQAPEEPHYQVSSLTNLLSCSYPWCHIMLLVELQRNEDTVRCAPLQGIHGGSETGHRYIKGAILYGVVFFKRKHS